MANAPKEYFTTPVGRIISGDPWTKQTTDANNRPIPDEKQNYWFALAIEKQAPGMNELLGTLHKAAAAGYGHAQNVMQQIGMGLSATAFSWKVDDGDEQRQNAQTGAMEPRWKHGAGCWIVKFSTTLPIRPAKFQGNQPVDCASSEIKRGYYVAVAGSTSANGNIDHTAGIYVNPQTIFLVGYGEEIVGGPSLEQQVAGFNPTAYMPAGMTQTPQAPTGAPGSTGQPAPTMQPPMGQPPMGQPPMGQPAQANPTQPGMQMPAPNATGGATTSPGSAPAMPQPNGGQQQPPMYGGYMTPPNNGQ